MKIEIIYNKHGIVQKAKAIPLKPIENEVLQRTEPTYLKEVKQRVINQPTEKVIMKTPQEQICDNYQISHQEYMNKKKDKANNLFPNGEATRFRNSPQGSFLRVRKV